jgi:arylsulfatase A-like enzyme
MRILYVDVDSLGADHTQPYGYARRTTPKFQELVERNVVFDRFHCSDTRCLPSRIALASGQFGIVNGVVGHSAKPRGSVSSRAQPPNHPYSCAFSACADSESGKSRTLPGPGGGLTPGSRT